MKTPTPKFQLFQQLQKDGKTFTVIGMEYVDPVHALLQGHKRYGFCYRVNRYYGKPIEELVGMNITEDDLSIEYWEDQLQTIAPAEVAA